MTIYDAIERACANVGIQVPKRWSYGKWATTDTLSGKNGKGDGRLIVNEANATAFNWQTGEKNTIFLDGEWTASSSPERAARVREEREKQRARARDAADIASKLVAAASSGLHPYLVDKGFRDEKTLVLSRSTVLSIAGRACRIPDGAAQAIVIPARVGNRITSAQFIWECGTKRFLFGGEIGGASHRIATGATTWLCEGYATALSVRAALKSLKMQSTVLCCFSASNIAAVAPRVRGRAFVAADNDKPLEQFGGIGTGEHYARSTELPYGMPADVGADFNDMHQEAGIFAVQRALTSIMAGRRAA